MGGPQKRVIFQILKEMQSVAVLVEFAGVKTGDYTGRSKEDMQVRSRLPSLREWELARRRQKRIMGKTGLAAPSSSRSRATDLGLLGQNAAS